MKERKKEHDNSKQTICLPLLTSACYFEHQLFHSGTDQLTSKRAATFSDNSSPQSPSYYTQASQSGSGMGSVTSDPSLPISGKNKRELVRPALLPLSTRLTVGLVFPHINGAMELKSLTVLYTHYNVVLLFYCFIFNQFIS